MSNNMHRTWGYYVKWNIRQSKTNVIWFQLYVDSKKIDLWIHRTGRLFGRGRELGVGEMGEGGEKVQTSSYKLSKFWNVIYSINIFYLKIHVKRSILNVEKIYMK